MGIHVNRSWAEYVGSGFSCLNDSTRSLILQWFRNKETMFWKGKRRIKKEDEK